MTGQQWLACADPTPMLQFLQGRLSARKLRLFACGCCRRIWDLLEEYCGRFAVELLELEREELAFLMQISYALEPVRHTARTTPSATTRAAMESVLAIGDLPHDESCYFHPRMTEAEVTAVKEGLPGRFRASADRCALRAAAAAQAAGSSAWDIERAEQATLLREVIGNPLRVPNLDPSWLHWNGRTVRKLAREIDLEQSFGEVPILADALEEAGCTDEAILSHCRGPGPHIRGCWVVDLVLGKE
jgi:hypothetical protein